MYAFLRLMRGLILVQGEYQMALMLFRSRHFLSVHSKFDFTESQSLEPHGNEFSLLGTTVVKTPFKFKFKKGARGGGDNESNGGGISCSDKGTSHEDCSEGTIETRGDPSHDQS
jgi:hypothetical protein